ncbi:unnamed protein product [Urochloa humidicola]
MAKVEDYASGSSTFAGVRPREDRKAQNLMEPLAAAHIPLKIHILCFSHSVDSTTFLQAMMQRPRNQFAISTAC